MTDKLTLNDIGVLIEQQSIEWVYYELIDLAIEYGFTVNREEYEVATALLHANVIDDKAFAWLQQTATEALHYINDECTYPNVDCWYDSLAVVLEPDFAYEPDIVGKWHVDDVRELYGVNMRDFKYMLSLWGYAVEPIDDTTFKIVVNNVHQNA